MGLTAITMILCLIDSFLYFIKLDSGKEMNDNVSNGFKSTVMMLLVILNLLGGSL